MLLFATVTQVTPDVRVRIPLIHKVKGSRGATPDRELPEATISTLPGSTPELKVGNTVIVGFETENYTSPIILGVLFKSAASDKVTSSCKLSTLDVLTSVTLPKDFKVGDVAYKNVECLKNLSENINTALSGIRRDINKLKDHTEDTSVHIDNHTITDINKITVSQRMYGDATKMASIDPSDGQLFFLLEE